MQIYSILSALLTYPEAPLVDALPEIDAALEGYPDAKRTLAPLTALLRDEPLIELQQNYVATFDRNPAHSLHLFEHVHGESRDRGQAMVDLLDEYRRHGFDMATNELPDYVPLFLEVLGALDEAAALALLDDAIHILAAIGERLDRNESPYASVFAVLRAASRVEPRPAPVAPIRDMDEALEQFGPGADGIEPLLKTGLNANTAQPLHFYPRANGAPHARLEKESR